MLTEPAGPVRGAFTADRENTDSIILENNRAGVKTRVRITGKYDVNHTH